MAKNTFVLIIEGKESTRKMLAECLPHYGCCPVTVHSQEEAVKLLSSPAEKISFLNAAIIGDPFYPVPMISSMHLMLVAQRIKEVLPGRPIISFPINRNTFKRETWADYNLQQPYTDKLFEVLQEISQKAEVKK